MGFKNRIKRKKNIKFSLCTVEYRIIKLNAVSHCKCEYSLVVQHHRYGLTATDNTNIPSKYLRNEQRFNNLATDPDQGFTIKKSTRKEAMTGLEAENQNLLLNIERGPKGIEFYDANRIPWDVKTPPGDFFNIESIGASLKKELTESKLIDGILHPPGKFIDPISGQPIFKKILLDCTYINDSQLLILRNWLRNQSGLTQSELDRIVEINVNIP